MSRHIVTCLVQNGPLAVARVAGVCAQRRYAVESFIAIPSEDPGIIRITLVLETDPLRITNAVQQLDKLIDVLQIDLLSPASPVACEMLLAGTSAAVAEVAAYAGPLGSQTLRSRPTSLIR
jgi:acetolactate synthase I/III small subunit